MTARETESPPPVALVTGGARRVGRAVALHLARHGWDIAVTYLTSNEAASDLAGQIEGLGRGCQILKADLTDPAPAAERIADAVTNRFGRLDLLLHNASLYEPGGLSDVTAEQMRRFFAIHAESPLLLTQRLVGLLRASRGAVIAMSDVNVDRPRPSWAAYTMSKAALANLVPSLARDLAPQVTVNAIAPGVVAWPDDLPQSEREAYLKKIPLARAGSPEDVAKLVHFLVTDGRYITGQTIRLDGGRSVR